MRYKKKIGLLICALLLFSTALGAALVLTPGSVSPLRDSGYAVHFSEIMGANTAYPGPGGAYYDWIEVHNSSAGAIDISGYHLSDSDRTVKYTVPQGTVLPADGYLLIWCDSKAPEDHGCAPFSISRRGKEVLYLMNSRNTVIDTVCTVPMEQNQSMVFQRGGWQLGQTATPGFANTRDGYEAYLESRRSHGSGIRLSELVSSNALYPSPDGTVCDYIELENTGPEPVSLAGFRLSDREGEAKYTIPTGAVIPARGYYVVWCDADSGAAFGLSRHGGETVCLQAPDGSLLDKTVLPPLEKNNAYARNAAGEWTILPYGTPGYSNDPEGKEAYVSDLGLDTCGLELCEAMSGNRATYPDENGCFQDWVEMYNGGDAPVDLSGWYLTDSETDLQKWSFPQVTIAPKAYLVVFCGGKDTDTLPLHTNFSLSSDGETVYLVTPVGSVADKLALPAMENDRSACKEDGSVYVTDRPTPGFENTQEGFLQLRQTRNPGPVAIWEVMPSNDRYLSRQLGEYPDWAELKNISPEPVSLSGWTITDRWDRMPRCPLPDRILQPGEICVILFSTQPAADSPYPVIPFQLSAEEDTLLLYDSDGQLSDYIHLYQIPRGCSMGRDETGQCYFRQPTPGTENAAGSPLISAVPTAFPAAGSYPDAAALTVTLSAPGTIYYTLDGSIPTEQSFLYEAPLELTGTTAIRMISVEDSCMPSPVQSVTYVLGQNHSMAILSLTADSAALFGSGGIYTDYYSDREIPANLSFYDSSGGSFSADCGLKLYGSMSRQTNLKKNFKVVFRTRYGAGSLEYPLFEDCDAASFSSLVLRAGQDYPQALMREELMTSLADDASDSVLTQHFRYCVLYINGRYFGIYCLKEAFSPEYYAMHHQVAPESVTVLRVTRVADSDSNLYPLMRYAQDHDLTEPEHFHYIAANVDLESLADWVILQAYSGNSDILNNVRYIKSTENDGKWRYAFYDQDWTFLVHSNITSSALRPSTQYAMIPRAVLKNPAYRDYFLKRLAYQLETTLSDRNVLARIDLLEQILAPEMEREKNRWGGSFRDWQMYVERLRDFVREPGRSREVALDFSGYFGLTEEEIRSYFGGILS